MKILKVFILTKCRLAAKAGTARYITKSFSFNNCFSCFHMRKITKKCCRNATTACLKVAKLIPVLCVD